MTPPTADVARLVERLRFPSSERELSDAADEAAALLEALQQRLDAAERDAERYRWLRQFIRVQSDEPGSWTRWVILECIPYRSKSEDAEELLDALIARFPLTDAAIDARRAVIYRQRP